jgi:hypothetical protein
VREDNIFDQKGPAAFFSAIKKHPPHSIEDRSEAVKSIVKLARGKLKK